MNMSIHQAPEKAPYCCNQEMDMIRFIYLGKWEDRGHFCKACKHFIDYWPNVQGD